MKLHRLYAPYLHNGEHLGMTEETVRMVLKFKSVAAQVEPQIEAVEQALAAENTAQGRIAKNPCTAPLRAADAERDKTLRSLSNVLKGYRHHPDPAVRIASEKLLEIPQLKPAVAARGYEEEEALLNILLDHLTGDYETYVAAAGVTAWVTQLAAQNAEVARLHALAYAAAAAAAGISVKEARKATDTALTALANRLDALIEMDVAGAFDAFIAEYSVMIKYYKTLIRERRTRNRHRQHNLADADVPSIADQPYSGDRLSPRVQVAAPPSSKTATSPSNMHTTSAPAPPPSPSAAKDRTQAGRLPPSISYER
jgi:hypothetical protein